MTVSDDQPNPVGRPTDYDPEMCEQARKFCLLGATHEQLAELLEVSVATIYKWKNDYPEFSEAIKDGKDRADATIAESLYHRAKGYSHEAVKIFLPAGYTEPIYAPYIEHYPPDTAAAFIWLKNRRRGDWRDRYEVENTAPAVQHNINLAVLDPETLAALAGAIAEAQRVPEPTLIGQSSTSKPKKAKKAKKVSKANGKAAPK